MNVLIYEAYKSKSRGKKYNKKRLYFRVVGVMIMVLFGVAIIISGLVGKEFTALIFTLPVLLTLFSGVVFFRQCDT